MCIVSQAGNGGPLKIHTSAPLQQDQIMKAQSWFKSATGWSFFLIPKLFVSRAQIYRNNGQPRSRRIPLPRAAVKGLNPSWLQRAHRRMDEVLEEERAGGGTLGVLALLPGITASFGIKI